MSGSMGGLPEGWIFLELEDLAELQNGFAFSSKEYAETGHFLIRIGNVQDGEIVQSDPKFVRLPSNGSLTKFDLNAGDILTSLTGNVGRIAVIGQHHLPAALNQRVAKFSLRSADWLDKAYLLHFLRSDLFKSKLILSGHGAAQQNVSTKDIAKIRTILAPLAEQKVIADKLDALLAQVDTLKARLDAIPAILKRFRQSVLSAAVTGKLTEEWQAGRKQKWQDSTLAELCVASRIITYGVVKLGDEDQNGVPCLRTSNVRWLKIDSDEAKRISPSISNQYSRTILEGGEVLVNVRGTLGGVAVVPPSMKGWNISREVAVVPVDSRIANPGFLALALASQESQRWLSSVEKGVAYVGINIEDLRTLPIKLPSPIEQSEIVHRVESLFAFADQIEARAQEATARVKHLTQSILAKAFRGELTEEWRKSHPELVSGQNSAEALLERIRAALAAAPETKGKRGRKASSESVIK